MNRRLPNLNQLRAFEAAARRGSFKDAAAELHVTHAAVSHQIKALEADLGMQLFHRRTRKVELTEAARSGDPDAPLEFIRALATGRIDGRLTKRKPIKRRATPQRRTRPRRTPPPARPPRHATVPLSRQGSFGMYFRSRGNSH